jgi:hypothetical protein
MHYNRTNSYFLILLCIGFIVPSLWSQEIKIFTTADYKLQGHVKNCLVLTNYGQEEFVFNKAGLLTKAVTRFNEKDYTITYYKYIEDMLIERRDEVYRDGRFEEATSMAHFFERDTLTNHRITEQIVNYNKEFVDRYEYFFDANGNMERIVRSSPEGVDETHIERDEQKGDTTTSYFLNEVLKTSIRESESTAEDGSLRQAVLTKDYIDGLPDMAKEVIYNAKGDLLSEVLFEYRKGDKTFTQVSKTTYEYDDKGILAATKVETGGQVEVKNYIFQLDTRGNWTKQIITPDNAYTTRKINYYPAEISENTDG